MGILDIFRNKKTSKKEEDENKTTNRDLEKTLTLDLSEVVNELEAPGWEAINREFERIYPNQTNPEHYGTFVKWMFGGNNPLDGISIYDGGNFWHFVSYGMSELYEKESQNVGVSGYGYEFTFKLKKGVYEDEQYEIRNICGSLQNIARQVYLDGKIFEPYEYIRMEKNEGIDTQKKSKLTGFICVPDLSLNTLDTIHGKVEFFLLIGVTEKEIESFETKEDVRVLYEKLNSDVTDYWRESLI